MEHAMELSLSSLLSFLSLSGVAHAIVAPSVLDQFAGAAQMSRSQMLWQLHNVPALRAYFVEVLGTVSATEAAQAVVAEFAAAQGGAS